MWWGIFCSMCIGAADVLPRSDRQHCRVECAPSIGDPHEYQLVALGDRILLQPFCLLNQFILRPRFRWSDEKREPSER